MDDEQYLLLGQSLREAVRQHTAAGLDAALAEIGWRDALAAEPRAAVALLFESQGSANATSAALDDVFAHALGRPPAATVLPALGRWHAPGRRTDGGLAVCGLATASLRARDTALVVVPEPNGSHLLVEARTDSLTRRPVRGIDAALGLVEVTGVAGRPRELGPVDWAAAVALGQLAVGHELVGAARRMLELAREHALARVQFGRAIALFQAVRHRLADTLVAIETADALLGAAWLNGSPRTAAMAKAVAGRSARTAARHCQQVLAGIGYTAEHPLHRYLRRVLVLEQLLGATRALTRELGREVADRRTPPPLLPL
jgi:Acyl-CoA dehydrogenase, C-terminal domain